LPLWLYLFYYKKYKSSSLLDLIYEKIFEFPNSLFPKNLYTNYYNG